MVNFGFNSASILGIFLAVAGAGLYFMRSLRPEISRDHDIFFAAVGLLCGGILLWHGWRLDPILQFSQLLLAGSAVFFAVESLRLRGVATEQARRNPNSSYVEEDRPVSRVYRAELAKKDAYEDEDYYYEDEPQPRRRLEGSRERSSNARNMYEEDQPRSRRPSRRPPSDYISDQPPRQNRSSVSSRPSKYDEWQDSTDHWEDERQQPPRRSSRTKPNNQPPSSRRAPKRRPKSPEDLLSSVGTEYVDYEPINEPPTNDYDYPESESSENENIDRPQNPPNFDY